MEELKLGILSEQIQKAIEQEEEIQSFYFDDETEFPDFDDEVLGFRDCLFEHCEWNAFNGKRIVFQHCVFRKCDLSNAETPIHFYSGFCSKIAE